MGLHAHINQTQSVVNIAIHGTLHESELAQLRAIIQHYRTRGCTKIRLLCRASSRSYRNSFDLSSALRMSGLAIEFAPSAL